MTVEQLERTSRRATRSGCTDGDDKDGPAPAVFVTIPAQRTRLLTPEGR